VFGDSFVKNGGQSWPYAFPFSCDKQKHLICPKFHSNTTFSPIDRYFVGKFVKT